MESSLRKSLIKLKPLFIFIYIAVLIVTLASNILLAVFKNKVTRDANKHFFKNVAIGGIFYLPPNIIIFRNVAISENSIGTNKNILSIPNSWVGFSLPELIINRRLFITHIILAKTNSEYSYFFKFVRTNFTKILDFLRSLPKQDIKLFIRGATLDIIRNGRPSGKLEANFTLKIKGDAVSGSGKFGRTGSLPTKYKFKGLLTETGISLEKAEFTRENLYCELWGVVDGKVSELKGFFLINTLFDESAFKWPVLGLFQKSKALFLRLFTRKTREFSAMPEANLYILDIDSRINFAYPELQIERLNFLMNNNPIKLKGRAVFSEPFACELKLFSNFRSMEDTPQRGLLKNITVNATAIEEGGGLNINGGLNIDFVDKERQHLPLEKIDLDLEGLTFTFPESPILQIKAQRVNFFSKTRANTYRISFDDLGAGIYKLSKQYKYIKFNSRLYDGYLEGKGRLEVSQFTPIISAVIRVKDTDAHKLDGLLVHFSKIYGRLTSQMYFINYPQLSLKGNMVIQNGRLKDFEFFKWMADLFALPALREIPFSKAGSNFFVDDRGGSLRDIHLESNDVKLKGYFELGENDLAASKMYLAFSTALLRKSPKFTPLLGLMHKEPEFLNFDFQLSGNLHGMNFLWMQSDFKTEVQRAIPGFVERRIERNIEKVIESISNK